MIKAIILSAGSGTRLSPLTDICPKPMLEIGGKPLLEHTIEYLRSYDITDIAINLHHLPEKVMSYFGDGSRFGVRLRYSIENVLLGTAGAVNNFRNFFDDTFIVVYGDVFTRADLKKMINFHKKKKCMLTIGLYTVDNPTECGIVDMDSSCRILRFVEKPMHHEVFSNLANAGVYVAEPEILKYIPDDVPSDFGKEIFLGLLSEGIPIYGMHINEYLIDIGTKEKYEKAKRDFIEGGVVKC